MNHSTGTIVICLNIAVSAAIGAEQAETSKAAVVTGLSGTVTEAATGDPLERINVRAFNEDSFSRAALTAADGTYEIPLDAGTYYVRVRGSYPFITDQIYDGLPCLLLDCDVFTGTPVIVVDGSVTGGIDFALPPGGAIQGRILEVTTGFEAVRGALLHIHNDEGVLLGTSSSFLQSEGPGTGRYRSRSLPAGDYVVIAESAGFIPELFSEIPCPGLACDPGAGTPITVMDHTMTSDVDFTLNIDPAFGAISGTVTVEPPNTFDFVVTRTWSSFVSTESGLSTGTYVLAGIHPGTYTATVELSGLNFGQLFENKRCGIASHLLPCDVSKGTPINVVAGVITPDIDFFFPDWRIFDDGFELGNTSSWSSIVP